jgi:hypothetical protein
MNILLSRFTWREKATNQIMGQKQYSALDPIVLAVVTMPSTIFENVTPRSQNTETFRRNILLPSLLSKNKPRKQIARNLATDIKPESL